MKLPDKALRQKGKLDLVLLVALLGPPVSLLFAHSCAFSCCPQALLKAISSVALTSVGALQSPDLQSPANKTLAYFSSCFSFQAFWNIMDCAFFTLSQGQILAEQKARDKPFNHVSSSSPSNSSAWSTWVECCSDWNYSPSFSNVRQIYSLCFYDPLFKLPSYRADYLLALALLQGGGTCCFLFAHLLNGAINTCSPC